MSAPVRVAADPEALARLAAGELASRLRAAAAARGRADLALAGGRTPRRAYQLLAAAPLRDAVPPDHPESNYRMAREALLDHVPLPAGQVHRIRAEAVEAEAAARDYEVELRQALGPGPGEVPRLDVVLLGMGADGHVASLFPGDPSLGEVRRLVTTSQVPRQRDRRVTLTFPVLDAARALLLLVAGPDKAERVAEVLGGRAPDLPASRLRPTGEVLWLLDEAAAARLPR